MKYSTSDFETIKNNGFEYVLPDMTLRLINKISSLVGSPSYIKTPVFKKKNYTTYKPSKDSSNGEGFERGHTHRHRDNKKQRRRNNKNKEVTDEEWQLFREFEKTQIAQKDNAFEIELDEVRVIFNKAARNNIPDTLDEIQMRIDNIPESQRTDFLRQIYVIIIDLACCNSNNSSVYAKITRGMAKLYNIRDDFVSSLEKHMEKYYAFEMCNPEEDYEKFCLLNKFNEERNFNCEYIGHLYKYNICSFKFINSIFKRIFDMFMSNIEKEGLRSVCEVQSEILKTLCIPIWKKSVKNDEFVECLKSISSLSLKNTRSYPSYSNKSKFNLMDIDDFIQDYDDSASNTSDSE
jgi:hypothetical protein